MAENTPRLKLKTPSIGEFDWNHYWGKNTSILDQHPGIRVLKSKKRPENPWEGQVIYCSEEKRLFLWNGSEWVNI